MKPPSDLPRAPLIRNTPMPKGGALARNAGPQKTSAKPSRPRDTGPAKAVVICVLERDGWACVRCGGGLWGVRGVDYSIQHRRARGAGGSRRPDTNQPQNLLSLCGSAVTGCHGWVESHRAEAQLNGWAIHSMTDPLVVPVLYRDRGLVYLTADGSWSSRRPEVS